MISASIPNFTYCVYRNYTRCADLATWEDDDHRPSNARSRGTRAALLDATRALLEDEGSAALTMGAVAERAGVSRRAVYLHFASREQLLLALFHHVGQIEDLAGSLGPVYDAP